MKKRSLSFKLIVGGIVIVLLPLMVVGFFAINKASTALEAAAKHEAITIAKDLSNMTQLVLKEEIKLAQQVSTAHATVAAATAHAAADNSAGTDIAVLNKMLADTMNTVGKDYESVLIVDAAGKVFADGSNGKHKGLTLSQREYFKIAKDGQANISTPIKSKISGKPIAPVCAPIYSADGRFLGAVITVLKIDFISEKITSVKVGETGYPFMVDKTGIIIAHPAEKHILSLDLTTLKGMEEISRSMLEGQTGVLNYTFEGMDKIAGFAPVTLTGWSIGVTQPSEEFMAAANSIRNVILVVSAIFLALTVLGVLWFARSISKPVNVVIEGLNEGADQVASVSGQVSSAGQSLAEGASEQAASIEETSSSLEEISSMTRQNADNANQADTLMKEANVIVDQANDAMDELTTSMEEISKASDETSKIIKTIDEIAFQTNLLALNAAVEAARAGEAGSGFAVVADEVRNLAMRAADAARNTAGLIEDTVKKIGDGSEIVTKTNDAFDQVSASTKKVADLVGEISAASNEQSQGIGQVNQAVNEMDKVVQQNAANAEESASAAEEMNAQAEQMKGMVNDLVLLVKGGNETLTVNPIAKLKAVRQSKRKSDTFKNAETGGFAGQQSEQLNAESVIPFDGDDFEDF